MSHIGETASITLITAVPGSGKTLRAVWYMRQAIERGEQVFACNVNGLNLDGVADFPDPTLWQDLPANSVLVVDECQRFFRAGRGVPDYIAAMETIRHDGIRLILLTQHPALIHPNIRALVGFHEHLVRENGKESAIVYTRSRVIDNVRSDKALAVEDHHSWAFPKDCYGLYKSAEVHTFKRTVPFKYKRAAMLALLALIILGGVVWQVRRAVYGDQAQPTPAAAGGVVAASNAGARQATRQTIETAADYAIALQPMIEDAPWTAPAFVGREMVSEPDLFCMSSGSMQGEEWVADSCSCLTEQGTRYKLDMVLCVEISRFGGRYNPFKAPALEQTASVGNDKVSAAVSGDTRPGMQPIGTGGGPASDFEGQASYGSMRSQKFENLPAFKM